MTTACVDLHETGTERAAYALTPRNNRTTGGDGVEVLGDASRDVTLIPGFMQRGFVLASFIQTLCLCQPLPVGPH